MNTLPKYQRLIGALAFLFASLISTANAQWGMEYPVEVSAAVEPGDVARGQEVTLTMTVAVESEYHIYAMDLQYEGIGPFATSVNLSDEALAIIQPVGEWQEPDPLVKWDAGFEANIAKLYGSPLTFTRTYRVSSDIEPGTYTLTGKMGVQACTEESCLRPNQLAFEVELVVNDKEPVAVVATASTTEDTETASSSDDFVSDSEESLGIFMLKAFGFGLLALLTPCVFPMIPITISFFTGKAAKSTGGAAKIAFIYVGSIIGGFMLLGLGISVIMRLMGAGVEGSGLQNAIAANPWVNIALAALYLFFFLALLEVVHLAMPQSLTNKLNSKAMGRTDAVGIFFKAMVFVLISFTCTAPLIGLLLVEAVIGDNWLRPFFGIFAFATGFALPFFFLAMAPQMLSSLPKSGSWLYSVKVVMAMLVLAAGFKFVSNADLILLKENMLLTREVLLAIWTAIAAVTGIYLLGVIKMADENSQGIGVGRLAFGTTFVAIALYLSAGLSGNQLHYFLEAYMPPDLTSHSEQVASASGSGEAALPASRTETGGDYISAGYSWFTDMDSAKEQAKLLGRNIFIDFTGYTCTNCRLMEKRMFPRPEVSENLEQYVRVKLYTDDPEMGDERAAYQARMFATMTLPFYAIVTPEEEKIATEAYTTDSERYVSFLQKGLSSEVASVPPR